MNSSIGFKRRTACFLNKTRLYIILACCFCLNSSPLRAQLYDVDTLLYHGDVARFINFVILSDGYQHTQLDAFIAHAYAVTEHLFNTSPFAEYKAYFNVFAIKVPSPESGVDHPATATDVTEPIFPAATVNTAFNSTFDYFNIHRLLVPQNYQGINNTLIANMPHYDQVLILVNSLEYGGSGGANATSSVHPSAVEILAHEVGHSFAGLADEYYAGDFYAGERVNMTAESDPALVRWKNWMNTQGIGIYQHCCGDNSSLWYRPHQNCKMRFLGAPFCSVCKENIVERIHEFFGTPIISKSPSSETVSYCTEPLQFSLSLVRPVPNTIRVIWKLNGNAVASNVASLLLVDSLLQTGMNTLEAECVDTTWFSRSEQHQVAHTYGTSWNILYQPLLPPVITIEGDTTFCEGNKAVLTSSPAAAYQWSHGAVRQSATITESGVYRVTITDANGCTAVSDSITIVVHPLPETPHIVATDSMLISSAPAGNQWYLFGEPIHDAVSDTLIVAVSGLYTVVVTDNNGCTAGSEPFEFGISAVGDPATSGGPDIRPNPNDGIFQLFGQTQQDTHVRIFSVFGNQVYSSTSFNGKIDLSDQPPGLYFLEAHAGRKKYVGKLIIHR